MRFACLAVLGVASSVVGCELYSLGGLTGGDAGADRDVGAPFDASVQDGTADADAPGMEAATDASTPPSDGGDAASAGTPVSIVTVGAVTAPSGAAQQGHLVWTAGTQQWWLFYADATQPAVLQSMSSADFVTWSPGTALTLPGPPSDGRNIAAWAGTAAGADVVHLGVSVVVSDTDRRHLHVRARPTGSGLVFDPIVVLGKPYVNLSGLDPDGPATALGSDGTLVDTSAWFEGPDAGPTGNEYAWSSTAPDPGGGWTPTFGAVDLVAEVPGYVNARGLVPLPGGTLVAMWESGDVDPDPTNVSSSVGSSSQWSPSALVFEASPQDPNDWSACSLGAAVHAVRHTSAGNWEHRVWSGALADGGAVFVDGGAIAALATPAGAGVVVLCDATTVHVFAIAPDPGNPVRTTQWNGTAWSAWSDAVAAGAQRTWLTGTITPGGRIALAWTETSASSVAIEGAIVGP